MVNPIALLVFGSPLIGVPYLSPGLLIREKWAEMHSALSFYHRNSGLSSQELRHIPGHLQERA